jgi:hypothetical protein
MKTLLLLAAFCCSGCYTVGNFVTDVHPYSRDVTGRPQLQITRCALMMIPFKGLSVEECKTTMEPIDISAPR